MKHFYQSALTLIGVLFTAVAISQPIYDIVSINAGYPNQSFYSMGNGEVSNVSNTNWDLAFQITGFQATIRINGKNNVHLYRSGQDANAWSAITPNDTVGILNASYELLDQDTSWWIGAFNATNDTTNQFDLGWGVYDFATHVVTGDSLYFIILGNGAVKKLWIQSLANSVYYFAYADLDGSNEVNTSISKANFTGKNFGYYSIENGNELNREPNKYDWDLTFCQYMAVTPITYKVTGVLSNDSVFVAKAYPVDVNSVSFAGQSYSANISTIGYDWKTYDFNLNSYVVSDSLVYFVQDRPGNIWKLIFTDFGGSVNGNYEFTKEQVSTTGINEAQAPVLLSLSPNPASDAIQLVYSSVSNNSNDRIEIYNVAGQLIHSALLEHGAGLQSLTIATDNLQNGIYTLRVMADGKQENRRFVIAR
ncbi:MAG TPA: T9SS type A sorting domain-containing protein [Bacteroidia bacterium]|nr:T9SS type A sorting domain-containing protein [Bacteroidia bacterium]